MQNEVFAVFVLAPVGGTREFAAVARTKGHPLGLPGGKVDSGETPEQALYRECIEEGWEILGPLRPVAEGLVEGRTVRWYSCTTAERVAVREGDNSNPVVAHLAQILYVQQGKEVHPYQKPLEKALRAEGFTQI